MGESAKQSGNMISPTRNHLRTGSAPATRFLRGRNIEVERAFHERQPLMRRHSLSPIGDETGNPELAQAKPLAGGTVLGIHNLAIVIPQFMVALVASTIFRIVDASEDPNNHNTYLGKNGVAWVLRFGGFCTLVSVI